MKLIITGYVLIALIILLIFFLVSKYNFSKRVREFYNSSHYPLENRKSTYKLYKKALKQLDNDFTIHFDYLSDDFRKIFKCKILMKNLMNLSSERYYISECAEYNDKNIHEDALDRIKKCLEKFYVLESAIGYFENHITMALKTIKLLENKKRRTHNYHHYYYPIVRI